MHFSASIVVSLQLSQDCGCSPHWAPLRRWWPRSSREGAEQVLCQPCPADSTGAAVARRGCRGQRAPGWGGGCGSCALPRGGHQLTVHRGRLPLLKPHKERKWPLWQVPGPLRHRPVASRAAPPSLARVGDAEHEPNPALARPVGLFALMGRNQTEGDVCAAVVTPAVSRHGCGAGGSHHHCLCTAAPLPVTTQGTRPPRTKAAGYRGARTAPQPRTRARVARRSSGAVCTHGRSRCSARAHTLQEPFLPLPEKKKVSLFPFLEIFNSCMFYYEAVKGN